MSSCQHLLSLGASSALPGDLVLPRAPLPAGTVLWLGVLCSSSAGSLAWKIPGAVSAAEAGSASGGAEVVPKALEQQTGELLQFRATDSLEIVKWV